MSDRDGLRRRAEVLQRVADQLSAQLRVERWSNGELRKLLGEPIGEPRFDEERAAARRFVTFASVAIVTAAAVALLASNPWHGQDTLPTANAALVAPFVGSSVGGTIVPFTVVVGPVEQPVSDKATARALHPLRRAPLDESAIEAIFGRPMSRGRVGVAAQPRTGPFDPRDIFVSPSERSAVDVP